MALRNRLLSDLRQEFADLPSDQMVAVTAHLLGQMVAMMDQRRFTPAAAMELVTRNFEAGNLEVIAGLRDKTEGDA